MGVLGSRREIAIVSPVAGAKGLNNIIGSYGMYRNRGQLGLGIVTVITLGIASRTFPSAVPAFVGKYPGDVLWAVMIFLGWAFVKPEAPTSLLAILALFSSSLVEFSQLYQVHWLNRIRDTTVGHLVLGSTFSWPDLCAYAVGVAFGVGLDRKLTKRAAQDSRARG